MFALKYRLWPFSKKLFKNPQLNYFYSKMPPLDKDKKTEDFVKSLIDFNKIVIFSKSTCTTCDKIKNIFDATGEKYFYLELDKLDNGEQIRDYLLQNTCHKSVSSIFVNGHCFGGCEDALHAYDKGRLTKTLIKQLGKEVYDYDLIVLGGGSAGLSCSQMAANYGAKVAVVDYVQPTPIGTTWGLGGTCVNVGCIPKKLMHQAALLGQDMKDSQSYGWEIPENQMAKHNWSKMIEAIQDHIHSLNWNYRVQLRSKKVDYINAFGKFLNAHRLELIKKNGQKQEISGDKIVIASGQRPKYPDLPGAKEFCITSDDLFSLNYNPGKTLCIGASYVSLECAGFLHGLGLDTTVMVRSILLRGFDQQMADIVGKYMKEIGIRLMRETIPLEVVRVKDGQPGELLVKYRKINGETGEEIFNTVLLAIGREACVECIDLEKTGVKQNVKNGKIMTTYEQTNIENIYGVGDIIDETTAHGRQLELTPVAIKAGQLLAKRLFGKSEVKMDYYSVPTTVFTPLEYGNIGYSEEEAMRIFGEQNIEVYHSHFWPLEWTLPKRPENSCYAKLICSKLDDERVVGFHVCAPNAGEITQGYALGMKMHATKRDFDMTVGIHPTCSEVFTSMYFTKRSGKDIRTGGC